MTEQKLDFGLHSKQKLYVSSRKKNPKQPKNNLLNWILFQSFAVNLVLLPGSRAGFWLRQPFSSPGSVRRSRWPPCDRPLAARPVTDAREATEECFIKRRQGPITLPLTYWGLTLGWGWVVPPESGRCETFSPFVLMHLRDGLLVSSMLHFITFIGQSFQTANINKESLSIHIFYLPYIPVSCYI